MIAASEAGCGRGVAVRWISPALAADGDGRRGEVPPPDGEAAPPTGEAAVDCAARALDAGDILVHPTSTVYGLGGRPRPDVARRIARLKRRASAPLIRLVADREALRREIPDIVWTEEASRLADAFWPGPLTLVLDDGRPEGVAVRVDAHPVIRALLQRAGGVLTSTSLNTTGRPPARTRAEVRRTLGRLGDARERLGWLDAGDLTPSDASTLFSLRVGRRGIVREGAIPARDIERALADDLEGSP